MNEEVIAGIWGRAFSDVEGDQEKAKALYIKYREGHCRVKYNFKTEDGYPLGNWVDNQRKSIDKNWMTEERRQRLDKIEFVWDLRIIS